MTTLYKPVPIETAEQAKALPQGSFQHPDCVFGARPNVYLVPIEAEGETRDHPYRVEERVGYVYRQPVQQTRLVTPWESE